MRTHARGSWLISIAGIALLGSALASTTFAETITLAWEAPNLSQEVSYRIYHSKEPNDPFVPIATTDETFVALSLSGSPAGHRYYVTAFTAEGEESSPSNVLEIGKTLDLRVEADALSFQWNASRYVLEVAPSPFGPWSVFATNSPAFSDSSKGMGFFRLKNL